MPDPEWTFLPEPESARLARDWAGGIVDGWFGGSRRHSVALVVSELVTNALLHGDGPICVCLERRGGQVGVAVSDAGSDPVRRRTGSPHDERGRGLLVVDALTDNWGVEVHADSGNTVWAVLGA